MIDEFDPVDYYLECGKPIKDGSLDQTFCGECELEMNAREDEEMLRESDPELFESLGLGDNEQNREASSSP